MALVNLPNILYNYLTVARKIKQVNNQFKFIFHNNNIKITNTIITKIYNNLKMLFLKFIFLNFKKRIMIN